MIIDMNLGDLCELQFYRCEWRRHRLTKITAANDSGNDYRRKFVWLFNKFCGVCQAPRHKYAIVAVGVDTAEKGPLDQSSKTELRTWFFFVRVWMDG